MFGAWEWQGVLHEIPVQLRCKWQQFAQRPDTFRTSDIKIAGGGAGFGMSEISAMRIEGLGEGILSSSDVNSFRSSRLSSYSSSAVKGSLDSPMPFAPLSDIFLRI